MEFVSLASGSKGNCYYLASNEGAFLVDCGISMKRIEQGVAALGKGGMDAIRGILLTHEHRDHIAGLGPVLRRHHIPVYGTRDTLDALEEKVIGKVDRHLFYALDDEVLTLADFHISYSRVSHDAADPVSYQITWQDKKIGMLTDSGVLSDENMNALYDSDILLIEANHDVDMLRDGPYPYYLKQRIGGRFGHLSNSNCAQALPEIMSARTKHVVLAHLSEQNNLPKCAYQTVCDALDAHLPKGHVLDVHVASQKTPLALFLPSLT